MKKISSLSLISLFLMYMLVLPAQAVSSTYQEKEVIHSELGDIEIETITTTYSSVSRSSGRNADRTKTVRFSGEVIAEITLSVTFGYDGKTSWVSSASGSHTTYGGWSYGDEEITKSGGTASLSATLSRLLHRDILIDISLTCSPTGQIS
ncbi:MAG: hypothetical protein HFF57_10250 [Lawsonibacter sp.]|nr:hypothetical protein [Lawsonibacter sp.]